MHACSLQLLPASDAQPHLVSTDRPLTVMGIITSVLRASNGDSGADAQRRGWNAAFRSAAVWQPCRAEPPLP